MPFRLPKDSTWLWKFLWTLAVAATPVLLQASDRGIGEHSEGGVCLSSNHSMGPDYVVLGLVSPRQIHFLAKSEIFDTHIVLCKLMSNIGGIPIERGKHDVAAMQTAIDVVKAGNILGMFPEGTRSRTGQLQSGKSGAVRIAKAAGAPVVPTVVLNSQALIPGLLKWAKPTVTIRFGPPIRYEETANDDAANDAETLSSQVDEMMIAIAKMLPPGERGVYEGRVYAEAPASRLPDEHLSV